MSAPSLHRDSTDSLINFIIEVTYKAERGFKTHGATVREGINTDGERDCSQQSGQQLAAGVHVTAV